MRQSYISAGNWVPQACSDYSKLPWGYVSSQNLVYLYKQSNLQMAMENLFYCWQSHMQPLLSQPQPRLVRAQVTLCSAWATQVGLGQVGLLGSCPCTGQAMFAGLYWVLEVGLQLLESGLTIKLHVLPNFPQVISLKLGILLLCQKYLKIFPFKSAESPAISIFNFTIIFICSVLCF